MFDSFIVFLTENTNTFAYSVVRIALGILFFFQAYDKIFNIKLRVVCEEIYYGDKSKNIPRLLTKSAIYFSSYLELIAGVLLIFGLFTLPVYYILGFHFLILIATFSYLDSIWNTSLVFSRFILLLILLFMPLAMNVFSIDYLFGLF